MLFEELYAQLQQRDVTMAEAAEVLGVTERMFRHWIGCYDTGPRGCRIGRLSARAVPVDETLRMVTLYETEYTGWTGLLPVSKTPS
jgi:hypothetical protein